MLLLVRRAQGWPRLASEIAPPPPGWLRARFPVRAGRRQERNLSMYIGIGTIVLIVIIVLVVLMLRRRV
jgi:hypothetical protein